MLPQVNCRVARLIKLTDANARVHTQEQFEGEVSSEKASAACKEIANGFCLLGLFGQQSIDARKNNSGRLQETVH